MKALHKLLILMLLLPFAVQGQQDIHFSQYMFNGLLLNPAYAGSREQVSVNLLARSQWVGFPGAPKSQTISIHGPSADLRHGFGFLLSNDAIGPIANTGLNLHYAYRLPLTDKATLSLGLQGVLEYYRTNFAGLRIDDQTDEFLGQNDVRRILPNAGFGVYLQKPTWYLGAATPRLIRNSLSSFDNADKARQWRHYFLTGGLLLDLSPSVKFRPSALLKYASADGPSIDLNASLLFADVFWTGISWRSEDAIVLMAEVWPTKSLRIGYAYDINTSALRNFNRGSHEISLGFDFAFRKGQMTSPRYF